MRSGTIIDRGEGAVCTVCGELAIVRSKYEDMCRFHWDCLTHELRIRLDTIRDFGPYGKDNGPTYGLTFYGYCRGDENKAPKYTKAGLSTIGMGLYVSRTPQEAMIEALRMAVRNNMRLLRLDTQNTVPSLPGLWRRGRSCVDIFRDPLYDKYMNTDIGSLSFDQKRFGSIPTALLKFNEVVHP